jgi:hypothetical protein
MYRPKENNLHVACYRQDTQDPGREGEGGRVKKLLTNTRTRKEESYDDASASPMAIHAMSPSQFYYNY